MYDADFEKNERYERTNARTKSYKNVTPLQKFIFCVYRAAERPTAAAGSRQADHAGEAAAARAAVVAAEFPGP